MSYVDARGYISLYLQPTISLREEARQAAETALTLQPNLGEAVLAKGQYHYACEKDYDSAVRYFEEARRFCRIAARFLNRLPMSRAGKASGIAPTLILTRPRARSAERFPPDPAWTFVHCGRRFPDALRKFDQVLEITPNDVDTLALKAAVAQAEGDLTRAAALLAPLHPAAANPGALETQIYQAILERKAEKIIPRLNDVLSKPDPTLGYYNGELRFWLGWAQEMAGDRAAAEETWRQARTELEPFLKEQPDNYVLIGDLALTNMGLGDKTAALTMAERAMAANPIEKDAVTGPAPIEILARVAARTGEPERALAALEKLLSIRTPVRLLLKTCRSLLRCSGSIQCSTRSEMIRGFKSSSDRLGRSKPDSTLKSRIAG